MSDLMTGKLGRIIIKKNEDGTYEGTAEGVPSVTAQTERGAILGIQNNINNAITKNESIRPYRIGS